MAEGIQQQGFLVGFDQQQRGAGADTDSQIVRVEHQRSMKGGSCMNRRGRMPVYSANT